MSNFNERMKRLEKLINDMGVTHCDKCGDGKWGRVELQINGKARPMTANQICGADGRCTACGREIELSVINVVSPGLAEAA